MTMYETAFGGLFEDWEDARDECLSEMEFEDYFHFLRRMFPMILYSIGHLDRLIFLATLKVL